MSLEDDVLALIHRLAEQRGYVVPGGVSEQDIRALVEYLHMDLPLDLQEWLLLCNAPPVTRGRLLGVLPHDPVRDIQAYLDHHPSWLEKGWIPVAVDAAGNPFVLATSSTKDGAGTPVLFIDHESSLDEPDYVVASRLWKFLWFLLQQEEQLALLKLRAGSEKAWNEEYDRIAYWPFDRAKVVAIDPDILDCTDAPMPWNVADLT